MSGRRHAIVVGAGHNGLVAGNMLVDAGWRVTVLEAASQPGGAVRSAELAAPGFLSDLGGAFFPLGLVSPALRALKLEEHGLAWRHAPVGLAHVLADGRCALLSRDVDQTAESVAEFAPADGDSWRALYRQWQRVGPHLLDALLRPFPPVRPGLALLRALGSTADALRFARWALLPVRRMAEERFDGDGGRLLLTGNALHSDLDPHAAGSGFFGWLLAMLGQQVGYPVPAGGAGRLTDALVSRFTGSGGELTCDTPVARVELRHGRAVGVRLTDGQVITADAVLADVPAPALYFGLVGSEHLPARFVRDLSRFQWDHGTVKMDWALSAPIPWTAEPARNAGVVHVAGDLAELSDYANALGSGRLPEHPFVLLGQLSTADPDRSPGGMATVWAYTHVPWGLCGDDGQHDDRIAAQVTRVEDAIERRAPGFRSLITGRHVEGPGGLARQDRNLVSGAINGGTSAMHQQLVLRPVPGLARPETPVPGLYLAGSSAHPGGGVHGACGGNAARAVLAADHPAGRASAAAVRLALRRLYRDTDAGW